MQMLDRLIEHMKSKPGVWFATHAQIASYVGTRPSLGSGVPADQQD
jgi:hypothetical protein